MPRRLVGAFSYFFFNHVHLFLFLEQSLLLSACSVIWKCPCGLAIATLCFDLPVCAGSRYLGSTCVLLIELVVLAALILVLLVVDFELGTHCLHTVLLDDLILRTPSVISEVTWKTEAWSRPPQLLPRPQTCWYLDTGYRSRVSSLALY